MSNTDSHMLTRGGGSSVNGASLMAGGSSFPREEIISGNEFFNQLTCDALAEIPTDLMAKVNSSTNTSAKENINVFMLLLKLTGDNALATNGHKASEIDKIKSDFFSLLGKDKLNDKSGLGDDHSHKSYKQFLNLQKSLLAQLPKDPLGLGNWLINDKISPIISRFEQQNPQAEINIRASIDINNQQRQINANNATTARNPLFNAWADLHQASKILDLVGFMIKANHSASGSEAPAPRINAEGYQHPKLNRSYSNVGSITKTQPSVGDSIKDPTPSGMGTGHSVDSSSGHLPIIINNTFTPNISIDGLKLSESQCVEKTANLSSQEIAGVTSKSLLYDLLQTVRNLRDSIDKQNSQDIRSNVVEPERKYQKVSAEIILKTATASPDIADINISKKTTPVNPHFMKATIDSTKKQNIGNEEPGAVNKHNSDEPDKTSVYLRSAVSEKSESLDKPLSWPKATPTSTFIGSVGSAQGRDVFNHRRGSFGDELGKLAAAAPFQNKVSQQTVASLSTTESREPRREGEGNFGVSPQNKAPSNTFAEKLSLFRQLSDGTDAKRLQPKSMQQSLRARVGNGTEGVNTPVAHYNDNLGAAATKRPEFYQQNDTDGHKLKPKPSSKMISSEKVNTAVTGDLEGNRTFVEKLSVFRQQSNGADVDKLKPKPVQRPLSAPTGNATLSAGSYSALSGMNTPRTKNN
ncbi:hypothetical protein [Serratia liquefaciens]|uniref:hypothetical protein n=1 Tax=Serratia liquefaciens TaxID=614 RepID=UPI0021588E2D|nr:hypothetical protein [Serratia liquefaciens]